MFRFENSLNFLIVFSINEYFFSKKKTKIQDYGAFQSKNITMIKNIIE